MSTEIFIPDVIISGGQTGVDVGALLGAEALNIATAGYMPKGWRTEKGAKPEYAVRFGLMEHTSPDYAYRTYANLHMCDAVLLIAIDFNSPGTKLTKDSALAMGLPCFEIPYPRLESLSWPFVVPDVRAWLRAIQPSRLNFAGNRESGAKGIEKWTADLVKELFTA